MSNVEGVQILEKIAPQIDLVESVKNALFEAILTGEILPGDKLAQDDLAEKMGVSRQPVIQALRILSEHGILCPLGKKGLTVSSIDKDRLLNLLVVRSELDCLAARLAATRALNKNFNEGDHDQIENIKTLINKSLKLVKGKNHTVLIRNDLEFHKLVRGLSGNEFIQSILEPHLLHHSRLFYIMADGRNKEIWEQHQSIFQSILSGDPDKAEMLTKQHTVEAETSMGWYRDEIS
jgi:DNA-binding GntR family transcriptional regulator